tara:strand:+ start:399 stop:542 length:144 start_codon:yes stop_codon:yes gene_type:complete
MPREAAGMPLMHSMGTLAQDQADRDNHHGTEHAQPTFKTLGEQDENK